MKTPYFVEILSHSREVKHRHHIDSLPIRIGRGYDNDIILDDPHTAECHIIVEQDADGNLIVKDQNSLSGIVFNGQLRVEMPIDGNTAFQLGHTVLRIRSSDFKVDDEIPVSNFYQWGGWASAITAIALIILFAFESTWKSDADKFELSSYVGITAVMLFVGIVWSGTWGLANRLFGEHVQFSRHFLIFGCGIVAMELFSQAIGLIAYAFSFETLAYYGNHSLIALLSLVVFFHLQQIKSNRTRKFSLTCIVLSILGTGLLLIVNYSDRKMLTDELFMNVRFPPSLRISSDKPVAKLIDDAKQLKPKVDKEQATLAKEDEIDVSGQD